MNNSADESSFRDDSSGAKKAKDQQLLMSEFENRSIFKDEYLAETMHVDVFASTFFAMRSKYKKQYQLLNEDVASYFFECMFILAI